MCSLFNNVKPPSWLPHKTDLHLFKEGIKPAWEDPGNEKGGAWTYYLPKGASGENTDKIWLDAVSSITGSCAGKILHSGRPGMQPELCRPCARAHRHQHLEH